MDSARWTEYGAFGERAILRHIRGEYLHRSSEVHCGGPPLHTRVAHGGATRLGRFIRAPAFGAIQSAFSNITTPPVYFYCGDMRR